MQRIFTFCIKLEQVKPNLKDDIDSINIVQPDFTLGGHIIQASKNSRDIKLSLPRLKKKAIRFTMCKKHSSTAFIYQMKLYNISCSLQACVLIHHITEENELEITIIPTSEDAIATLEIFAKNAETAETAETEDKAED